MKIRDTIGALAVAAALACLGPSAHGSDEPAPDKVGTKDGFVSRAYSDIEAGKGVRLVRTNFQKHFGGVDYNIDACESRSDIPDEVTEATSVFCYLCRLARCADVGYLFYYDIHVPDGRGGWIPSGYWVDGGTKVPFVGERVIQCAIKRAGSTVPDLVSPFSCETSWSGSGGTSWPHWKVTAKPVTVIDASIPANADRAAQLIGDHCDSFDTPRCTWTRTGKSSAFIPDTKDWVPLTNWADSCAPATKEFTLKFSNTKSVSWSDTFGGKIATKISGGPKFVSVLEGSIEADWHHSFTHSDSFTEEYTYYIPLGYRSALYLQHGMLEVTGDFSIITDTDRYLVRNATFRFPLTRDVTVAEQTVRRGIVQHTDVPCSHTKPANGAPPPHGAIRGPLAPANGR